LGRQKLAGFCYDERKPGVSWYDWTIPVSDMS
jgi:hypothetical protein